MSTAEPKRILILGGGFGGIYAALRLQKKLWNDPGIEITLVGRDNFFLFTPMLHEVAASDLEVTDIVTPIRSLLKRIDFYCGEVEAIDLRAKSVSVSHGYRQHRHELRYDYLLLALGSTTNFFKLPGVQERALTMKSLGDAIQLRNLLIAHLEEADPECGAAGRSGLMTFVVAGGGFAGIETIASINDFVRDSLRYYSHLDPGHLKMIVVHPGDVILPELGPELGEYAQRKLGDRGIEILTNVKVASANDEGVTLSDGRYIPCKTLIWTAGTAPHPIVGTLPCRCDRGRVAVNEFLEVDGWPGVWAVGDCAVVPDKRTGKPHPPTAQHALREGRVAADNLIADIRGTGRKAFDFVTLGQLAAIGHRTGVARVFGIKFSGFIAWWLWRTIYLSKLPSFEKKVRVAMNWTLDMIFPKDLVQFMGVRSTTVSHTDHDEEYGHSVAETPAPQPTERPAVAVV